MNVKPVAWVIAVFLGASLTFGYLRQWTEHSSTLVTIAVQVGALAVIIGALVLFVRHRERER